METVVEFERFDIAAKRFLPPSFKKLTCPDKIDFLSILDTILVTLPVDFRDHERFVFHRLVSHGIPYTVIETVVEFEHRCQTLPPQTLKPKP